MIVGQYTFTCQFLSEAILPSFKGSTVRGLFGNALKKVVCALKKNECGNCLLREQCLYSLVFETPHNISSKKFSRIASPPHPFVIEPPATTKKQFEKDDTLDFTLILFGEYNQKLPYFIYAFEQMGHIGIGKKMNGKRGLFELISVKQSDEVIYISGNDSIKLPQNQQRITSDFFNTNSRKANESVTSIAINFETPLRLKFKNSYVKEFPFHILTRAMLRRVSSLYSYYHNGEPVLDYKKLVKQANDIKLKASHTHWFDWKRYSHRQNQSMLMGGVIGRVEYEGALFEFLPLIKFSCLAHLGKQTAFGLGKLRISEQYI